MKKVISFFLMLLIMTGFLGGTGTLLYLATPPSSANISKIVLISPGSTFKQITRMLQKEGIIRNVRLFSLFVRYHNATKRIQAGEYYLNTAMLPIEVLDTLVKGKVIERPITIPEGYNIYQIADLFDENTFVNKENFLNLCFDPSFISSLGVGENSLEGYLFPDTYRIPRNIDEKSILEVMVSRFKKIYSTHYAEKAKELGFTRKEVVVLASMIEKESGNPWESPFISAVFQNRLKKGIRLQSDPTAVYGIENFNGKITSRHLKKKTPYNTYMHYGLPPGPISNPGENSIKAVLYPADVDYLYFVSKNNGTHHFSRNFKEHSRAVHRYQRKKRQPPLSESRRENP